MNIPFSKEQLKAIGVRIRDVQKNHNLNDSEMAEKLGISVSAYRKIIYGQSMLSLPHLVAICKELNVDYALIIDGIGDMTDENLFNRVQFYLKELQQRNADKQKGDC